MLTWRSRSYGLQDRTYEVLVQLKPGDKARWLEANHLRATGEPVSVDVEGLEVEICRAGTPKGAVRATTLEGLPREHGANPRPDGDAPRVRRPVLGLSRDSLTHGPHRATPS